MPTYIVLEIQVNVDGTVGTLIDNFTDRDLAESKFHQVLSYAAVSHLKIHSCILMTADGFQLDSKSYKYEEPVIEPENSEGNLV